MSGPDSLIIHYKNYAGKMSVRNINPTDHKGLWYGESKWHSDGPQWFINAYDYEKDAERDFALKDIIGEARYKSVMHLLEQEADLHLRDMLPVGHAILEQAENIDGGTVTQTVKRPNGTEYHRIVDSEEAYGLHSREHTMVLDATDQMICVGDVVRLAVEKPFQEFHGSWSQHVVEKAPGGYRLSYLSSEQGVKLPRGYTGGMMSDYIMESEDKMVKDIVFALVPIKSHRLTIIGKLGE